MERIHIHKQNTTAGRGEKLLGGGGGGGVEKFQSFLLHFLGSYRYGVFSSVIRWSFYLPKQSQRSRSVL